MKFCLILIIAGFVNADDTRIRQAESKLSSVFSTLNTEKNCGGIEGSLDNSCYECYTCEDDRIKKYSTEVKQLRLKSGDCVTVSTVCCIQQIHLGTRTVEESCGRKMRENGKSQSRATVRSVLHGEYPWRVWIYKKDNYDNGQLLCTGTVVSVKTWVVMTSASCLYGLRANEIAVGLTDSYKNQITDAHSIIIHPSYKPSTQYVNDIALLALDRTQDAPGWVKAACLPTSPPMPATTCITISDKNFYISAVVPILKSCESFNIQSTLGQLCAIAPQDDYTPQQGGALLCQDEPAINDETYNVAGIALTTTDSVTTYTAVHHYYDWIKDKIAELART